MKQYLVLLLFFSCFSCAVKGQFIRLRDSVNYDTRSLVRIHEAIRLLDSVVHTPEFKTAILNARMVGTKGFSNQEIFDQLFSGNTAFEHSNDQVIDLYLGEYDAYAGSGQFGVTIGPRTNTHRCFVLQTDIGCLAGHLLHEYMHVMGFTHGFFQIPTIRTVPYTFGDLVSKALHAPHCVYYDSTCTANP